ncbi:unnamed protein product [Sphacelaria rigidula]
MRATPDRYNLEFFDGACHSTSLSFFPGEHQWMVNLEACPDAPKLSFVNETYVLINVHIHSVSEHSMGTASHDAEVHMVHVKEGTDDELLVVGVLLDENTHGENDNIHDLWDVMVTGQEMANSSFFFSAYEMLPQSPAYSHYMGSLTTPPCTESVVWIVMSMSTVVGHSQLTTFREAMGSAHLVRLPTNHVCSCPLNLLSISRSESSRVLWLTKSTVQFPSGRLKTKLSIRHLSMVG